MCGWVSEWEGDPRFSISTRSLEDTVPLKLVQGGFWVKVQLLMGREMGRKMDAKAIVKAIGRIYI